MISCRDDNTAGLVASTKDNKFDLVLSNEVIADLNVSVAEKEKLKTEKGLNEAEKLIKTYDLDIKNFPPKFILTTPPCKTNL